jgi:hypothetical protein
MEQEPYEFWTRPAKPESKGKATHGKFRKYAFLASKKTSLSTQTRGRIRAPLGAANILENLSTGG